MSHFCDNDKCALHHVDSESRTHTAIVYSYTGSEEVIHDRLAVAYIRQGEFSEYHLCDVCANVCKMLERR